jgi:hypothetical protein
MVPGRTTLRDPAYSEKASHARPFLRAQLGRMKLLARSMLAVLLTCATTWAQTPPPIVPTVPVDVVGTRAQLAFTISDASGRPVAECSNRCRLQSAPNGVKFARGASFGAKLTF